jgi:hypothetical protein
MDQNEILTGAITTIISAIIGVVVRHFEKKKLRRDKKLID